MPIPIKPIYQQADQFRRELAEGDVLAASRLVKMYGQSWQIMKKQALATIEEIAQYEEQHGRGTAPQNLQRKQAIFDRAIAQIEGELLKYGQRVIPHIERTQKEALEAARSHASELIKTGLGTLPSAGDLKPGQARAIRTTQAQLSNIRKLPLEFTVGTLGNGSPLAEVLKKFGEDGAKAFGDALATGVALGHHPRQIVRNLQRTMTLPLAQTMTVARTEAIRAYREATHQVNNSMDAVVGWRWCSALTARSCAMCIAQHGKSFPKDQRMTSHPSCRCTQIPITIDWSEIQADLSPIPDTGFANYQAMEMGPKWLEGQTTDIQKQVLGGAAYRAWKAGAISIRDLVGKSSDSTWGNPYYLKSLKEVLGDDAKWYYRGRNGPPQGPGGPPPAPPSPPQPPAGPSAPAPVPQVTAGLPLPPQPIPGSITTPFDVYPDSGFAKRAQIEAWWASTYPKITLDLEGIKDIKVQNRVVAQFNRLSLELPGAIDRLEMYGTYKGAGRAWWHFGWGKRVWGGKNASAIAHASVDGKRLGLNPKYFGLKEADLDRKHQDMSVAGWLHPGGIQAGLEVTITHEYGHHVDYWLSRQGYTSMGFAVRQTGFGQVSSMWADWKRRNGRADSTLSEYGATSTVESIAEGFSAYHHAIDWLNTSTSYGAFYAGRLKRAVKALGDVSRWVDKPSFSWTSLTPDQVDALNKIYSELAKELEIPYP